MIDDGSLRSGVGSSSLSGKKRPDPGPTGATLQKEESLFQIIWQEENGNQDWKEEKIE
jgi:hypothetical protein